ncbi:hypothetical protein BC2230_10321 [Burkholderia cepacia]
MNKFLDIQQPLDFALLITFFLILISPGALAFSAVFFYRSIKIGNYIKSSIYGFIFLFFAAIDILAVLVVLVLRSGGPMACCY